MTRSYPLLAAVEYFEAFSSSALPERYRSGWAGGLRPPGEGAVPPRKVGGDVLPPREAMAGIPRGGASSRRHAVPLLAPPLYKGGLRAAPTAAVASPAADPRPGTMAGQCAPARSRCPSRGPGPRSRSCPALRAAGWRRPRLFLSFYPAVPAASGVRLGGQGLPAGGGAVPPGAFRGRALCPLSPRPPRRSAPGSDPSREGWSRRRGEQDGPERPL